jgi:hypothetical protein
MQHIGWSLRFATVLSSWLIFRCVGAWAVLKTPGRSRFLACHISLALAGFRQTCSLLFHSSSYTKAEALPP